MSNLRELFQQEHRFLALPLARPYAIGDYDDRCAGRIGHVCGAGHLRGKSLNRRGLHDVERLARGNATRAVD